MKASKREVKTEYSKIVNYINSTDGSSLFMVGFMR